jgi:transcriptional regulator with XRE-family HTH domain
MQIIYDYLKLTGISQADLARKAEIEVTVLNNLLKGRRKPGMITIKRLHRATGISLENLVRALADEEEAKEAAR